EDRRRNRFSRQNIQSKAHQPVSILLREIPDRGYQPCSGRAKLIARLRLSILPNNGAIACSARLLEGAESAKRTRIIGCADQDSLRARFSQMLPYSFECRLKLPVAIERDGAARRGQADHLAQPSHHASNP